MNQLKSTLLEGFPMDPAPDHPSMPLRYLSPTRQEILLELRRRGSATVDDLAEALNFTVGAVRQQLLTLSVEGLVTHHPVPKGPGRPRHVYELTPAADPLFQPDYGDFYRRLAEQVEEECPEAFESFFRRETNRAVRAFQRRAQEENVTPEGRIDQVKDCFEERGFLPSIERTPDGGLLLTLANCPVSSLAEGSPRLCEWCSRAVGDALPAYDVRREAWRGDGKSRCVYRLMPRPENTAQSA
jgi:DeoR family suf operon transcriptional repressor